MFHLLHHLPMFMKRFGPIRSYWMYHFERFNSWISRRVLNRRHPESTVIETYRLTEWASFLELSGQLSNTEVEMEYDTNHSPRVSQLTDSMIPLTGEQMDYVTQYYLAEISDFRVLTDQYNKEKSQAKEYKEFPSMSEWNSHMSISDREREMYNGPSSYGTQMKNFVYKTSNNRTIMLSSAESDCEYSYRRCSYVRSNESSLQIGRILMLFHHSFLSETTSFAYVSWFDNVHEDCESKLIYVLSSAQTQTVVPIKALSKPLVVACDDEESEKLWILN